MKQDLVFINSNTGYVNRLYRSLNGGMSNMQSAYNVKMNRWGGNISVDELLDEIQEMSDNTDEIVLENILEIPELN
jgi:hypothetical protein